MNERISHCLDGHKKTMNHIYSVIADEFDHTRYALWHGVKRFLDELEPGAHVLDAGCGNGKYLGYRADLSMVGVDACPELVDIASKRYSRACVKVLDVMTAAESDWDCVRVRPFDAAICVAVVHHFDSPEKRRLGVAKVMSQVRPGGRALFTVWGDGGNGGHVKGACIVPWRRREGGIVGRYYYIYRDEYEVKDELVHGMEDLYLCEQLWLEMGNYYLVLRRRGRGE